MTVIKDCPKCGGWGRIWKYYETETYFYLGIYEVCPICKGKGKIETKDYEG